MTAFARAPAGGRDNGVGAVTVMLRLAVAVPGVGLVESVTLTVKLKVPVALGIPVIAPLADKFKPVGKLPV
jgi:hypothetical protein